MQQRGDNRNRNLPGGDRAGYRGWDNSRGGPRSYERDGERYGSQKDYGRDDRQAPREDRYARRPRSRSRSRDREPAYARGQGHDGYRGRSGERDRDSRNNSGYQQDSPRLNPVSATVIIKGLSAQTTEPVLHAALAVFSPQNIRLISSRDTGECKGFAFVQFYSVEYSEYFMKAYAGSTGDPGAAQLIIDNRAVALDYARNDQTPFGTGAQAQGGRERGGDSRAPKTDWLCDTCGCQNFSRRMECYKCSLPRGENAITLSSVQQGEPVVDPSITSETPSATLVAKGLPPLATEEQIAEMFRQYALVSNVLIMRDRATNISRGIAFIEFHGTEHAMHAKTQTANLQIGSNKVKVGFARPGYEKFFQNQNQSSAALNPYAMAALQAAQWSSNNVYHATPAVAANATAAAAILGAGPEVTVPARLNSSKNWPPNFDTEGASYHFQPKSGCFLDPVSQYYYCPRSKTYYNSMSGEYYRHVGGSNYDELYQKILIPEPSTCAPEPSDETSSPTTATELPTKSRKPVVLSMGFKTKSKTTPLLPAAIIENKPSSDAVPSTLLTSKNSTAFAKMSENVNKWTERRREENEDAETPSVFVVAKNETTSTVPGNPAVATASAAASSSQPVCLLCRRQFPSFDVLKRHERESKLHADNVAKAKVEAKQYRDRASERRLMNPGDDVDKKEVEEKREDFERSRASMATVPVPAAPISVDRDEANPGNALLRRMGWADGKGLGKEGSGEIVPVALNEKVAGSSLAPGEKNGVGSGDRIPSLSYGENMSEYKKSLHKATKARFDMVNQNPP